MTKKKKGSIVIDFTTKNKDTIAFYEGCLMMAEAALVRETKAVTVCREQVEFIQRILKREEAKED
jgi:hypothetical protein